MFSAGNLSLNKKVENLEAENLKLRLEVGCHGNF